MNIQDSSLLIDGYFPIAAFDFDGNILSPDTPIYLVEIATEQEISISGHELDKHPEWISGNNPKYRWHYDITDSLVHFRDFHSSNRNIGPDGFMSDIESAMKKGAIAASFRDLKEKFLIPGRPFAIITARGHGQDNLARAIWIISEHMLTPDEKQQQYDNIRANYTQIHPQIQTYTRDQVLRYYFERVVDVYPISNAHVEKLMHLEDEKSMSKRKAIAMQHYVQKCVSRLIEPMKFSDIPRSYGFSDDSLGNMRAIIAFFLELRMSRSIRANDKVRLYFTGRKEDYDDLKSAEYEYEERDDMLVLKI